VWGNKELKLGAMPLLTGNGNANKIELMATLRARASSAFFSHVRAIAHAGI